MKSNEGYPFHSCGLSAVWLAALRGPRCSASQRTDALEQLLPRRPNGTGVCKILLRDGGRAVGNAVANNDRARTLSISIFFTPKQHLQHQHFQHQRASWSFAVNFRSALWAESWTWADLAMRITPRGPVNIMLWLCHRRMRSNGVGGQASAASLPFQYPATQSQHNTITSHIRK